MSSETFILKQSKDPDVKIPLWSKYFAVNWFYLWVIPIISNANRKSPLTFSLRKDESSRQNVDDLENAWFRELSNNPEKPSIYRALYAVFGKEYLSIAAYKLSWTFFTWAGAWYLLKAFLQFMSNSNPQLDGQCNFPF